MVETTDVFLRLPVRGIVEQQPIKLLFVIPLDKLGELGTHKIELLAWMRHHIAEKSAKSGKFLPVIARHLVDQRTFAVHHFVMTDRKDKIF